MKKWIVEDVMSTAVVAVPAEAPYRTLVDTLVKHRVSALPVVDDFQRVLGVVSEADLLRKIEFAGDERPRLFEGPQRRGERNKATARVAAELMSSPAVSALTGTTIAAAARLMDREGVKRLPVVDDLGRLVGIVTRGDLLKVHLRPDDEILADVRDGIRRTLLPDESEKVEISVDTGVVTLSGKVDRWSTIDIVGRLVRQIPGVADVVDELTFAFDDRTIAPGIGFGVA